MLINEIAKRVGAAILPVKAMQAIRAHRSLTRGDNPELALLPRWNKGGSFVDIGANVGDYSRVASRIFSHVHAFEPIPTLANKLRYELPDNVTVYRVALSHERGEDTLHIPVNKNGEADTGLASLNPNANGGQMVPIPIKVETLDSYNLTGIDVIKIDVEGLEWQTLNGAIHTIMECRPVLIVEVERRHHSDAPEVPNQVFYFLQALGYHAHYLAADGTTLTYTQAHIDRDQGRYINNFIFIPHGAPWRE